MTDTSTEHPLDMLMNEHEVILAVIGAIDRKATDLESGASLDPDFWLAAHRFITEYADRRHHGKEEDLLFPKLVEHGFAEDQGPIFVMKHEHVQGRDFTAGIRAAAEAGDMDQLLDCARGYVFLLRDHIQKENVVLFELARQTLPPAAIDELRESFAGVERELGGTGPEDPHVELAGRLCQEAGTEFHGRPGS